MYSFLLTAVKWQKFAKKPDEIRWWKARLSIKSLIPVSITDLSTPFYKAVCYIAGVLPATARPFIAWFIVTWHLTMKLFPAKCHERATLRKLWCQAGNSSLLPAKCWPLLHVICQLRDYLFSTGLTHLLCYITNHLMTVPLGNSEFCFPRISMFRWDSQETKFTVPLGTSH